jgi:hypothetical protein
MPARRYNRWCLIRGSCATKDLLLRRGGIVSVRGNQEQVAGRSARTDATLLSRDYNVDTPFINTGIFSRCRRSIYAAGNPFRAKNSRG